MEHQLSFADFAILYRTSAQAAPVAEALARRGFPVQQRSHGRLADMAGVAQILTALSAPVLGSDSVPDSVPVAGRLTEAVQLAVAGAEGAEAIVAIRAGGDVLTPLAARCGSDLDRFLDELALGAEVDTWDPRADRISLLTLHAAKGLEFPVVFIVGCDDGLLPLRPWGDAAVDYDEERRLFFVGMTRATTRLVLLTAARRQVRGEMRECSPSPFLSSIDSALLERRGGLSAGTADGRAQRRGGDQQFRLF
jgi:DNA helicase II / ATP-dependent DNA helicase PcrA